MPLGSSFVSVRRSSHAGPASVYTSVGAKGGNSVLRPACKVLFPGLVGLPICLAAPLGGRLGLSDHVLAVEDEEWDHIILLELVEILGQVRLDTCKAAEGREEGLMVRRVVVEEV